MKILFVYPDINIKGEARSFQFGIGHLSSFLKTHGYETGLFYMYQRYNIDGLKERIDSFKPGIIAFTATTPQFKFVKQTLKDLGRTSSFTICGGPHVTLDPNSVLTTENLDSICRGEGEYPMLELCRALEGKRPIEDIPGLWIKKNGKLCKNNSPAFIDNIDKLPFPDRELFNYQEVIDSDFNTALFMFSRGCPYNCSFCSNHALRQVQAGRYVRFRTIENCLAEIENVIKRYKVETLYFNDDVFTLNKPYVIEFCKRYKEEFSLPFDINARVEGLDKEVCQTLKDAGCRRVNIGIECGHEEFRRNNLHRNMTNQTIMDAFETARGCGLKTKSFNIAGFPYETKDIFKETININKKIQPDSLVIYIFEPYPGTELMDICIKDGFLEPDYMEKQFKPRTDTLLNMPGFTKRQIRHCYKNFGFNVYKNKFLKKAIFYKIYYSDCGDLVLRILSPFKKIFRRMAMGI